MSNVFKGIILTASFMTATLCVFAQEKPADSNATPAQPAVVAPETLPAVPEVPAVDPAKVLAVVNGEKITYGIVDAELEKRMPNLKSLPANLKDQYMNNMRKKAIENMIIEKLLEEQIKAKKIVITEAQIMSKIEEIAAQNNMTMDQLKARLAEIGKELGDLKSDIQKGMTYEELFNVAGGSDVKVTEEDAKLFYEENKASYDKPEQVKASHILVKIEKEATEEQKAEAKKKIEDILAKVKAGDDFAALAKDNSDCPSKDNGGDLGFFTKEAMVKPFSDAAFALEPGQISDVVETTFGYHIIKVTDKKAAYTETYEEVKDSIIKMLEAQKKSEFARSYIEDLKKNAKIEYSEEMKPQEEQAPKANAENGEKK